jgi:hypothetical protein
MHSIGSHRELYVNVPISYVNKPENVQFTNTLPTQVSVLLQENRLSFINYIFVNKIDTLRIDLGTIDIKLEQGTKSQALDTLLRNIIYKKFKTSTKIINYEPKIVVLNYITLQHKLLQVALKDTPNVANGFIISDEITFSPNVISAYGKTDIIDTLTTIYVEKLKIDSLTKTTTIKGQLSEIKYITFKQKEVSIHIPVDRAIDKSLSVPISCINAPNNLEMKSFPSEATIKFVVAMAKFNNILPKHFTVIADYSQKISDKNCVLYVGKQPNATEHIRVEPQEIEFSLEAK